MGQIRTAVLPAAGLGTRFLPATKCVPKELLPLLEVLLEEGYFNLAPREAQGTVHEVALRVLIGLQGPNDANDAIRRFGGIALSQCHPKLLGRDLGMASWVRIRVRFRVI